MGRYEEIFQRSIKVADGEEYKIPSTIDEAILGEIGEALKGIGYAKKSG